MARAALENLSSVASINPAVLSLAGATKSDACFQFTYVEAAAVEITSLTLPISAISPRGSAPDHHHVRDSEPLARCSHHRQHHDTENGVRDLTYLAVEYEGSPQDPFSISA
jgi:hypothetical protein